MKIAMITKEQVKARIEQHHADNHNSGERLKLATSKGEKDLIQTEQFGRNRAIIELQWVLSQL